MDVSDEALAALAAERDAPRRRRAKLGRALSAARHDAADRLASAVTAELAGLAMPDARVTVTVASRTQRRGRLSADRRRRTEVALGPTALDEVEILLRPHPDAPALPVRAARPAASCPGSCSPSRCAWPARPVPTMVFDEVDAGVGGRAAVEVGRRLARLARDHQVVVVTHLPQVAAYADRHVVVDKPEDAPTAGSRATSASSTVPTASPSWRGCWPEAIPRPPGEHAAELLPAAAAELADDSTRIGRSPARR